MINVKLYIEDGDLEEFRKSRPSGLVLQEKPIIYLYPEEEIEVAVSLGFPELLTTTYPAYNNGWNVLLFTSYRGWKLRNII